ncbi:conserved hypothetical protein [Leishmania major strain Friedlin]|uniref:Uncharacterized protein n=1 Tax=Leishmania major TaxID=5664 RepID=Q4Q2M8_LEIMA|nr:conserved hypothetical protein [Leishmania major strain Friedlin]CAG9582193.1 hypothetical_protein_-_conserved [Leishmania major strain Friedlin]CAJ08037.1 conserved hypothetical protein [Leishmania major strain Friedlin]|eukprot:XP_001686420.1 conserved hypothetical protein [Leishmania major strain Friedlin]
MSSDYSRVCAAEKASESHPPGYSRDALETELREGFRKQQQQVNKNRQVEQMALAKGLGESATTSLKDGFYIPHKVLPPLKPEEKKLFERIDIMKWCGRAGRKLEDSAVAPPPTLGEVPAEHQPMQVQEHQASTEADAEDALSTSVSSTASSLAALKDNSSEDVRHLLHQLRSTSRATSSLRDARAEVDDNIQAVEEALLRQSSPLSFEDLLDTAARLLAAMERGELTEDVVVPRGADVSTEKDEGSPGSPADSAEAPLSASGSTTRVLHGAVEVETYTRKHLLPRAYQVVAIAHTAEWILQYTMAYLRTTVAVNQDEAFTRLTLLARCVRLLGDIENFSSILLSLETKCEEYAGFAALKDTAEKHLGTLLDDVETSLDAILSAPFPSRRSRLLLLEGGIQKKLQRALLFLNEIDYSWTPHVRFHWAWKVQLLSASFHRIHGLISRKHMQCSMGFVDDSLYERVADTRITGRYMGASPVQPKVLRAQQVEYEKITEGLTFQQIGMSIKGVASLLIGEQLCMGARYILCQSTKQFDPVWGFHMDEISTAPTQEELSAMAAKIAVHAKEQLTARPTIARKEHSSSTFLTQM